MILNKGIVWHLWGRNYMKNCGVGGGELVHLSYGVSGLLTRHTYGICHENMGCCESFFFEHHKHGH
jgi:hypothetical protein